MKKNIFVALFLIVFSFVAVAQTGEDKKVPEKFSSKDEVLQIQASDVIIGDENAPVTIIEYASMSCSHCASFHINTYGDLKEKYIDTGKAKFIFRDFPLDEPALRAAMVARCADKDVQGSFEKFNKVMFSTQSNWAPKKNYLEVLSNIAKLGGMASEDFETCIADGDLENEIMEGKFYAFKYLEIRSTPSFVINGDVHKGAKDIVYLSGVIDAILEASTESGDNN